MAENINKTEQENNSLSIEKDKSSTETKTLLKNVEKKEISPEELLKRA
ncbi:MAG: hypothetical protein LBU14_00755 [Candidatus Peribacteria bacterium]|jgi:hypothetical protein|nr:hypothetical protein [Candidatus Peribacteria bacterium]